MLEKILVADDDLELQELIKLSLESNHYQVISATDGEEALNFAKIHHPDLIILDVMMPKYNGFEVCQMLRENTHTCLIPIIMLTSLTEAKDRITGIKLGADEYLTKPFLPLELVARVEGLLKRTKENLAANPLTGLPGNVSIEKEIKNRLESNQPFAVIYTDLDNFKAYNDYYGFEKGDGIIRLVATIIRSILNEYSTDYFVGHIGGDDFVIILKIEDCEKIIQKIVSFFNELVPSQYEEEDRNRGYIPGVDRFGNEIHFPFLSLSFGCCMIRHGVFKHYSQIVETAKDLLKQAKLTKSSYKIG